MRKLSRIRRPLLVLIALVVLLAVGYIGKAVGDSTDSRPAQSPAPIVHLHDTGS